ncbi:uncharacterized protein LOC111346107 [Stylophora pistillata]|uniref:uncharacterized protein LOC111346107 n=1 Tax=Stylophora pistillata TaxID=50429 RepID=UPI000C04221F|nr:uncharacterized protein LOC111346107 [Stylophora pistillata]
MPIFDTHITSLDGKSCKTVEFNGSKLAYFTTVRRPDMNQLKLKYSHTQDKRFYMTSTGEHQLRLILRDGVYSRIRTERVLKGHPGEPLAEETTFGWVVHGGDEYESGSSCMYIREVNDYNKLYSLDVQGVEDRGENGQLDVLRDFKEGVVRRHDGMYEVGFPWIPGPTLTNTNEALSRKRLKNVERKLSRDKKLKGEYGGIIEEQLRAGVIEEAPQIPSGKHVFYMPHKPIVKQSAVTTKSANVRKSALLGVIAKAFFQIGLKEEDRDAVRFYFNIKGIEKHLRFTRVPFGVEASPFLLGATVQHHFEQQGSEFEETVRALKENTYVDNLMQTGGNVEKLVWFKEESTAILESARFPVHKWESNVKVHESEGMPNPSKILGHVWNKDDDTLELLAKPFPQEHPVTKHTILSYLGTVYDPLGIISPTMAKGNHIYQEACNEKKSWNAEVSSRLKNQWLRWTKQLKDVRVPRSIALFVGEIGAVHLHFFADASILACCAAAVAAVKHEAGVTKGLLTSKSRISKRSTSIARLELMSGHMAVNMAKNLSMAIQCWLI